MKSSLVLALAIFTFSFCFCDCQVKFPKIKFGDLGKFAEVEGRIGGGQLATSGQFPYQVLLLGFVSDVRTGNVDATLCGGILLTSRAVLTVSWLKINLED